MVMVAPSFPVTQIALRIFKGADNEMKEKRYVSRHTNGIYEISVIKSNAARPAAFLSNETCTPTSGHLF